MINFLNNLFVRILLWGFLANWALDAKGQPITQPQTVEVTFNKTCSIVFPAVIKSVDRGSRDVLAQKAKGVGNVLQLKAGRQQLQETNLTVITADGSIHEFTVNYSDEPKNLIIDLSAVPDQPRRMIFKSELTEADVETYSKSIAHTKRRIHLIGEKKYQVSLSLLGIYIKEDVMFYKFRVRNASNINYDIDFFKFYIEDKARIKRTASQEVELKPVYVFGNDNQVKGKSETDLVYALEKFTIPEAKRLNIEMLERNGGRNFNLLIKNKTIVNAKTL